MFGEHIRPGRNQKINQKQHSPTLKTFSLSLLSVCQDLSDPMMVMCEHPEEAQEGIQEENTFQVTEAIPDVELFGYKTLTRSIHVLSGA